MALIDLSKMDVNISRPSEGKRFFYDEGASAYESMSKFGDTMFNVAQDLYAKNMDVNTTRESTEALLKFEKNIELKKDFALNNIDEKTNLVRGTQDTLDSYMAKARDTEYNSLRESLKEDMSKSKFDIYAKDSIAKGNTRDVIEASKINRLNTLKSWSLGTSEEVDNIINSDPASAQYNYQKALDRMNLQLPTIEKVSGLVTATKAKEDRIKVLLEKKIETDLRNMEIDQTGAAAESFSNTMGPALVFKDLGEYKAYVQKKYSDTIAKEGYSPALDQAYKDMIEKAGGDFMNTFADSNLNLLSADQKMKYLDRALDIKLKGKKEAYDSVSNKINDWKNNFVKAGTPEHVMEAKKIFTDKNFRGDKSTIIREVKDAAIQALQNKMETDIVTGGKTSLDQTISNLKGLYSKYLNTYLDGLVSPQDYNKAISDYPSLGEFNEKQFKDKANTLIEKWRTEANTNPENLWMKTEEYNNALNSTFKFMSDGSILIDPVGVDNFRKVTADLAARTGTVAGNVTNKKLLPAQIVNKIHDQLQLETPEQQMSTYKSINKLGPDLAMSYYKQLIGQKKMTVEDASLFLNLSDKSSAENLAAYSEIIGLRNEYTGEAGQERIKKMNVEGWLGKDNTYDDALAEVQSAIDSNDYLAKLRQTASASGLYTDDINMMFYESNIRLLAMDKLSKGKNDGFFSLKTLSSKAEDAVQQAVEQLYGQRMAPVNSDNLNATINRESDPIDPDNENDIELIKKNAEELAKKVKEKLRSGDLKIDFSDYPQMNRSKKLAGLDDESKQYVFTRELADKILFNTVDITGKSKELHTMFTDGTGGNFRLRLVDNYGNKYVPKLPSIKDLKNSPDVTYNKVFAPLENTKLGNTVKKEKKNTLLEIAPQIGDIVSSVAKEANTTADDVAEKVKSFIMASEGEFFSKPTVDAYGVTNVGYSHVVQPGEKFDKELTEADAKELLKKDIAKHQSGHLRDLTVKVNANQLAALTAFAYQKGPNAAALKKLVEAVNKKDIKKIKEIFLAKSNSMVVNKKTGKSVYSPGVHNRRKKELELFLTKDEFKMKGVM